MTSIERVERTGRHPRPVLADMIQTFAVGGKRETPVSAHHRCRDRNGRSQDCWRYFARARPHKSSRQQRTDEDARRSHRPRTPRGRPYFHRIGGSECLLVFEREGDGVNRRAATRVGGETASQTLRSAAGVAAGSRRQSAGRVSTAVTVSDVVTPSNARCPDSISNSTQPKAQMSVCESTALPIACSGPMQSVYPARRPSRSRTPFPSRFGRWS